MYPFGFGLSYTTFEYQWTEAGSISSMIVGVPQLSYRVTVTNSGKYSADTSVLAFISHEGSSASTNCPIRELFAFQKISLSTGESKELFFSVSPSDSNCVEGLHRFVDPGLYHIQIGDLRHSFQHNSVGRIYL